MSNQRKSETKTDFNLQTYINKNRKYTYTWDFQKTTNPNIQTILDKSSRAGTGSKGSPD